MKIKSSTILQTALDNIRSGKQNYACAAIQDAEVALRWEHNQEIQSKAKQIFSRQMPKTVRLEIKDNSMWWPKGDPLRLEALQRAIDDAESKGD